MILSKYFPTIIGTAINSNHKIIRDDIIKKCYNLKNNVPSGGDNWISNSTYNTIGKHEIFSDPLFLSINDFVVQEVKEYCKLLNIKEDFIDYKPNDSWFNIYNKGDYQEYHHHANSVLSVVYFLKTSKNPAKIYFKNPHVDMRPPLYNQYTPDTFERIYFEPIEGMMLIFRSHLEHSVEKQIDEEDRISIAYNFRSDTART